MISNLGSETLQCTIEHPYTCLYMYVHTFLRFLKTSHLLVFLIRKQDIPYTVKTEIESFE